MNTSWLVSFTDLKRKTLRERRKAILSGIPERMLNLADYYLDRAIYLRKQPDCRSTCHCPLYRDALREMHMGCEVLTAYTEPQKYSLAKVNLIGVV